MLDCINEIGLNGQRATLNMLLYDTFWYDNVTLWLCFQDKDKLTISVLVVTG